MIVITSAGRNYGIACLKTSKLPALPLMFALFTRNQPIAYLWVAGIFNLPWYGCFVKKFNHDFFNTCFCLLLQPVIEK